jgi:hypothetical protein
MTGYLVLLVLLGVFTARIVRMKGIKTQAGYAGAVFWVLGVLFYFVLAQIGSPDVIILILISIAAPLFHIISLLIVVFNKKHTWKDPAYKNKSVRLLLIFTTALAIYVLGLIIA